MGAKDFQHAFFVMLLPILTTGAILHEVGYFMALDVQIFSIIGLSNLVVALMPKIPLLILYFIVFVLVLIFLNMLSGLSNGRRLIYAVGSIATIYIVIESYRGFEDFTVSFSLAIVHAAWIWEFNIPKTSNFFPRITILFAPFATFLLVMLGFHQGKSDLQLSHLSEANAHVFFKDGKVGHVSVLREYKDILLSVENGLITAWNKSEIRAVVYRPSKGWKQDSKELSEN